MDKKYTIMIKEVRRGICEIVAESEDEAFEIFSEQGDCDVDYEISQYDTWIIGVEPIS